MYSKAVLERVKEGLSKEILKILSRSDSTSSNERHSEALLIEFLENALRELSQQRSFRKQALLRIDSDGTVQLPPNVVSVESVWHKGNRLGEKKNPQFLSTSECVVDTSAGVIHVPRGMTGAVEINCTIIPKEEDIPKEAKRSLVLYVKAQCCEHVARKLKSDPSLKFSKVKETMNNPETWERQAQILRQRFAEAVRAAPWI